MRKIKDYTIIVESVSMSGHNALSQEVRNAIKHGWEPLGPPQMNRYNMAQAIVKYEGSTKNAANRKKVN